MAPTDFSADATTAVASARELAKQFGAKRTRRPGVERPPSPVEGSVPPPVSATWVEDRERQATVEVAQVGPAAEAAKVAGARVVAVGTPDRTISETAEATHVEWRVRATAGRTASCPVLTRRPHA